MVVVCFGTVILLVSIFHLAAVRTSSLWREEAYEDNQKIEQN